MSRIKVPSVKKRAKRNIPITRVGKKQYLKRRFAHVRAVDRAGADNKYTAEYVDRSQTAAQSFAALGLAIDPSLSPEAAERHRAKVAPAHRRQLHEENENSPEYVARRKAEHIARPVSEQEGSTIANLIAAHGTDYKRMSLDRRLNPFQLNVRQLQRQCANYLRWERAAMPAEFAAAEAKGYVSVERFEDPKLRSSAAARLALAPAPSAAPSKPAERKPEENTPAAKTSPKSVSPKKTIAKKEKSAPSAKKAAPRKTQTKK